MVGHIGFEHSEWFEQILQDFSSVSISCEKEEGLILLLIHIKHLMIGE